ncbi:MAG TPA: PaaI family thioesterase, partial [Acidimicrobiales bacterium]|nr:PaaI family thioesterase [Acidimicrobiales bacterium]
LITLAVGAVLDDDDVLEAAKSVEEVTERLASKAGPRRPRPHPDVHGAVQEFFPTSPIIGLASPLAPPVRVEVVPGRDGSPRELRAEAYFEDQYEGPPTCVHGGVIAETFDELLGAANIVAGYPAMTGTLTVRYRKPTPLRTPIRIEARTVGREGRKVTAWGGMYHGELLTAEAEGIFVQLPPERFLAVAEGNVDRTDPDALEFVRTEAVQADAASDVHFAAPPD